MSLPRWSAFCSGHATSRRDVTGFLIPSGVVTDKSDNVQTGLPLNPADGMCPFVGYF